MLGISISGTEEVKLNLKHYSEQFPKHLIRRLTQDVHEEAVKNASVHTKTGTMENNIALKVKGTHGEVYIEDDGMLVNWMWKPTNYALFVHFGTRPHTILPKKRKELRFGGVSAFRFFKSVEHPGYKGDPFMTNAAKDVFRRLNQIAKEVHNATK